MSAWIGPMGTLIPFKCPSAVESDSEDPHVYFRPLGGDVTVTRLGDGTRPRVWDVSVSSARPDHVAALQGLADGEWGPGPFVFVPPAAETLNLLGKREAMCLGVPGVNVNYAPQPAGTLVSTTEGPAGNSYSSLSLTLVDSFLGSAPVIAGQAVTGKVWAQANTEGPARAFLRFYDAANNQLGATPIDSSSSLEGRFLHFTMAAPAGATYCSLFARGSVLARPQITWTDGPRTWSPSAASQNVVVSPLSAAVRRATGRPGEETISDHRFTVTELRA